jgi:GAF domain-containing protein
MMRTGPSLGYYYDEKGVSPVDAEARSPVPAGDGQLPELTLPVQLRGRVVATIQAHKPGEAGEWTADEVALLKTLIEQLGVALEGAQLYQSTQLLATREQMLNSVTARIRAGLTLEQVLNATVQEVSRALGAPRVAVWLEPMMDEPDMAESKSRVE